MQRHESQHVCRFVGRFRFYGLRLSVCLAAVVFLAPLAVAEGPGDSQPAENQLKSEVARILKDLASDSRKTRSAAETRLLKLGPRVLPLLPPPELTREISVREAVRRIRLRLEHDKAQQSVKASTVTLKGKLSLGSLLREVTKQTGNGIDVSQLPLDVRRRMLTVSYRETTFWSVIADVSNRAAIDFTFVGNRDEEEDTDVSIRGDGLTARQRDKKSKPPPLAQDNSGAFRVELHPPEWQPLFGNGKHRLLRVHWSIAAEPRLRPLFLAFGGKSVTAAIGKQKLEPFDPDGKYEISANEPVLKLHMNFLIPRAVKVRTIRLAGKMRVLTAAAEERFAFRHLEKAVGAAKRRGGVTVTVRKVTLPQKDDSSGKLKVGVAVAYDTGGPAFESHRTWVYSNRVFLESTAGQRIEPLPGYKTILQRDGAVGVEHAFRVAGNDVGKLQYVYMAPTLLINVPVEFDFAKIPVPAPPAERTSP